MDISNEELNKCLKKLLLSRMRVLLSNGFYGLLLMHSKFSLDEECETVSTNGETITFGPNFLLSLREDELDYVIMHEILHIALQHCFRKQERDDEKFDEACDIVVNSNILLSNKNNISSITIQGIGAGINQTPSGDDGYKYSAEEIYEMLQVVGINKPNNNSNSNNSNNSSNAKGNKNDKNSSKNFEGNLNNSNSNNSSGKPNDVSINGNGKGNSNGKNGKNKSNSNNNTNEKPNQNRWDDHSKWGDESIDDSLFDEWQENFKNACEIMSIKDPSNSCGSIPAFAQRMWEEFKKSQTDWRTVLDEFVQEEINDYSFTPPDRRFDDSPFFLPDYNEKDNIVKNILFMIDTSASMSDEMITAAYSEIKGAIDQFNGKLQGWLGFFDATIFVPIPFADEEEFKIIRPKGGGGTDFYIIFNYIFEYMTDDLPTSIIILTDGYAPFPKEEIAQDIPTLWLLNNEEVNPPWGKVTRIKL